MKNEDETSLRPVTIHQRPANAEPQLRVVRGDQVGAVFWLEEAEITVGRDETAPLRFTDSGVSRNHAKLLRARDGLVSLLDLNSTNGTFVNGTPVDLLVLREGDQLQLGPQLVLQFGYRSRKKSPESALSLALSARQIEVACMVAKGLRSAEIADALGIRTKTVHSHLNQIYVRLGINSRASLTRLVVEGGHLQDSDD